MTPPQAEYREIPLTRGQIAYVSPHRFEEISSFKWYALWNKQALCFYAARTTREFGKRDTVLMHRQILGLLPGDRREGDHIDRIGTLNNTDSNLRIADHSQQMRNRGIYKCNKSGYKGVRFCKANGLWRAEIRFEKKTIHLGYFGTARLAYEAYCKAAIKYFGEFACII